MSFGDSVFEDTDREFDRQLRLVQAGILRRERMLEWYLGLDGETVERFYLAKEGGEQDGRGGDPAGGAS